MKLYCPGCDTPVEEGAAIGMREMHCGNCGIRFSVPEPSAEAAKWGEVRNSRLAVISVLAGIGSLVLPFCMCPFVLFGFGMTAAAPVVTPAAPIAVPAQPTVPTAVNPQGAVDPAPGAEDEGAADGESAADGTSEGEAKPPADDDFDDSDESPPEEDKK